MRKLHVGILGATGMVGQRFIELLHEHPDFEVSLLTASERSKGLKYRDATRWLLKGAVPESIGDMILDTTKIESVKDHGIDLVFSALPSEIAYDMENKIAQIGIPVFSNAGAHRMRDEVPILIPEINSNHLELVNEQEYESGFIVTNSNCSTSGLVFGLKPLMQYGIEDVTVTTMQAVSGAGRTGVSFLDILGNIIPYIRNEEEKMESETRKILGDLVEGKIKLPSFSINATCTRVPVLDGHLESIAVRLEDDLSVEKATRAFSEFSSDISSLRLPTACTNPIVVLSDPYHPQPSRDLYSPEDPLGMSVKIGRIRKKGSLLTFLLLVHNTMRGAAGASVLNAEYALSKRILKEVIA